MNDQELAKLISENKIVLSQLSKYETERTFFQGIEKDRKKRNRLRGKVPRNIFQRSSK